jgi:hypothetical protein
MLMPCEMHWFFAKSAANMFFFGDRSARVYAFVSQECMHHAMRKEETQIFCGISCVFL